LETKHSYEIPGIGGQRGYVSLEQNIKGRKEGDLKEFWHFGVRWRKFKICFRIPNVVVKELPRFNAVGKEAYQMLEKLAFMF
jgi:hypothetical protein